MAVAVNYVGNGAQAEEVAGWVRAQGRRAITVEGDVSKRADVEAMVDKTGAELGPIDLLGDQRYRCAQGNAGVKP